MFHQVPNDEEVGVKAHAVDNTQFMFKPLLHFGGVGAIAVAFFQPLFAEQAQVSFGRVAFRHFKIGQFVFALVFAANLRKFHFAHFGNFEGVFQCLGHFGKKRRHFFGRTEVVGIVLNSHTVGVSEEFTGLDSN